ncbi:MAG: hypothetical protein JWR35_2532 [Marmoricola sp.]|nr:hypothetical protein [Marmoricola sp.]
MHLFAIESGIALVAFFALIALKFFVLIDAVTRPAAAYLAADKLTKPGWLWILGLTLATQIIWPSPVSIIPVIGTIAAFVYLLDVRPALASLTRR